MTSEIKIDIHSVCDPLTEGSFRNPNSPWVGYLRDEKQKWPKGRAFSLTHSRLQALMEAYVERRSSGCAVLVGGDRGAGKTSMILKAIEELRRNLSHKAFESADQRDSLPDEKEFSRWDLLTFPRPMLVRVHGPGLAEAAEDPKGGSKVLKLFALALNRALSEEVGLCFAGKAQELYRQTNDCRYFEMAAQFRVELDGGSTDARLREMWSLLHGLKSGLLAPDLTPGPDESHRNSTCYLDQAHKELLAISSCLRIYREFEHQQSMEDQLAKAKERETKKQGEESKRSDSEESSFIRFIGLIVRQGGHLIPPILGILVGGIVFASLLKNLEQLPVAIVSGILASVSTTLLLNLAIVKRNEHTIMQDGSLASMERAVPVLLRRIEDAGLYPIFVVDELDKVEDPHKHAQIEAIDAQERPSTTSPTSSTERTDTALKTKAESISEQAKPERLDCAMQNLTLSLKDFFAGQAFTCFLVSRQYYDRIADNSRNPVRDRPTVSTFFSERILVSYQPFELLAYLDKRLELAEWKIGGTKPDEEKIREQDEHVSLEFLKHLYLYRAKGHLGDLHRVISSDRAPGNRVYIAAGTLQEVPPYQWQVIYQLAAWRLFRNDETMENLRQRPDRVQPLYDLLYGPARLWEKKLGSASYWEVIQAARKLGLKASEANESEFAEERESLDFLTTWLEKPHRFLTQLKSEVDSKVLERAEIGPLADFLALRLRKGEGLIDSVPYSLSTPNLLERRFFWRHSFGIQTPIHSLGYQSPNFGVFHNEAEFLTAGRHLLALESFLKLTFGSGVTPLSFAQPGGFVDYICPFGLTWQKCSSDIFIGQKDWAKQIDLASLSRALMESGNEIRAILLIAILETFLYDRSHDLPKAERRLCIAIERTSIARRKHLNGLRGEKRRIENAKAIAATNEVRQIYLDDLFERIENDIPLINEPLRQIVNQHGNDFFCWCPMAERLVRVLKPFFSQPPTSSATQKTI